MNNSEDDINSITEVTITCEPTILIVRFVIKKAVNITNRAIRVVRFLIQLFMQPHFNNSWVCA